MLTFAPDHLCKPDLTLSQEEDVTENPKFQAWREAIFKLSRCSRTYMKLSGSFSEISESLQKESGDEIFKVMQPWLIVLLATFGASRTMFGSDWPVCMAGTGDGAWIKWRYVVERLCDLAGFTLEDNIMLWSGTAIKAYGIESLM
jgi:L-rhamnono-1,4-lactonase